MLLLCSSAAAQQALNLRLGVRYGHYQKGLSFNSWTRIKGLRIYSMGFFNLDQKNYYTMGTSYKIGALQLGGFLYFRDKAKVNLSGRLNLGRAVIGVYYRAMDHAGNMNLNYRFNSGAAVTATGALFKGQFKGQVEASFPLRISIGKKRERPPKEKPVRVIEIPTGDIHGRVTIDGIGLQGVLLELQGDAGKYAAESDIEGRFELRSIPAGPWLLEVKNAPKIYYWQPVEIRILINKEIQISIELKRKKIIRR